MHRSPRVGIAIDFDTLGGTPANARMEIASLPIRRPVARAWRLLGVAEQRGVAAASNLLQSVRVRVRAARSLPREQLVLRVDYPAGLFAEFAAVLGLLDHFEAQRRFYAGVAVRFGNRGLYYEPAAGENWWEYYFEPLPAGAMENAAPVRYVNAYEHVAFTQHATRTMSRARGHSLIRRHVRVRKALASRVDTYAREHFGDARVIGVHYRGTDKSAEAPRVRYEDVLASVHAQVDAAGSARCRVFVATDEQAFLDRMLKQFGKELIYCDAFRSIDGAPAHGGAADPRKRGEEAVVDCLLLARCNYLIRTPSNLGLCTTFFNPRIETSLLSVR